MGCFHIGFYTIRLQRCHSYWKKKMQVCGTSQSLNETDFYHVPHFLSLTKYFTSAKCCMRKHALIEITFAPAMCYYKILVPKSSSTCQQVRLFFLSFLIDGLCKNNQETHKTKQTRCFKWWVTYWEWVFKGPDRFHSVSVSWRFH